MAREVNEYYGRRGFGALHHQERRFEEATASHRWEVERLFQIETARLATHTIFHWNTEELTEEKTQLREQGGKEAQSAHASAYSEKQKRINNLESKSVSLQVTIETKEKTKLQQIRSESHEGRLCSKFGIIKTPSTILIKLLNSRSVGRQAVLPRVTRHLVRLAELQSQGKRLLAVIQTCILAAIIKLGATPLRRLYSLTQFLPFWKEM